MATMNVSIGKCPSCKDTSLIFLYMFYNSCFIYFFSYNSDHCATSIIDLHRSCPSCSYELCLSCCQEIRDGSITPRVEQKFSYVNRGYEYMHGGDPLPVSNDFGTSECHTKLSNVWNAKSDGSIRCAPKEFGGCGSAALELRRVLPSGWISELEIRTRSMLKIWENVNTTLQQKKSSIKLHLFEKG